MARQETEIEVRDLRKQPFFWVSHEFIATQARLCGPYPALVYMALCHHAGRNQKAWPSTPTLAAELGISSRQVMRAVLILEDHRLIRVEREDGRRNTYYLIDVPTDETHEPVTNSHGSGCALSKPVTNSHGTSDCQSLVLSIEQESVTRNIPPLTPPDGGEGVRIIEESFLRFWAAYPKRKSKARALKAWMKLKPSEQLVDVIIAAIERATTSVQWTKEQGKFIPYPASWLNDHAWEDEYQPGEIQGQPLPQEGSADPPKRRIIKRQDGSLAELKGGEIIPIDDPRVLSPPPVNGNAGFNVAGFVKDIAAAMGSPG